MTTTNRLGWNKVEWAWLPVLEHSTRTAIAAVGSFLVARMFRLPEAYWAPITTLVITQSSLGAAVTVSSQRLVGTALGALVGALAATYFGRNVGVFCAGVFILGLVCAAVGSDRAAYRFGGVTLAIVMLVPRAGSGWEIAVHRFAEVFIGIVVALVLTLAWPEKDPAPPAKT